MSKNFKIKKDPDHIPLFAGGKKEEERREKEKKKKKIEAERDEAHKKVDKEFDGKIQALTEKGKCAAITLAYGINAITYIFNKNKQETFNLLTENAYLDLEGTINSILKLFGGANQIGINLRGLTESHFSFIKAMDKVYVEKIIPEAFLQKPIGKAFVYAFTTGAGFGFINGQYFSERNFYLNEKNHNSEFYRESLAMLKGVQERNVSLEIAIVQLENRISWPIYRIEKETIYYKLGKFIGYSYQILVNYATKNLVMKSVNSLEKNEPLKAVFDT